MIGDAGGRMMMGEEEDGGGGKDGEGEKKRVGKTVCVEATRKKKKNVIEIPEKKMVGKRRPVKKEGRGGKKCR